MGGTRVSTQTFIALHLRSREHGGTSLAKLDVSCLRAPFGDGCVKALLLGSVGSEVSLTDVQAPGTKPASSLLDTLLVSIPAARAARCPR